MTRINVVPPSELSNKHLVAEYRELPRVIGLVRKCQLKGLGPHDVDIPDDYVLGPGHVKFFYDKLMFISARYNTLVAEMRRRGYAVTYPSLLHKTDGLSYEWFNTWNPGEDAVKINRERISQRS